MDKRLILLILAAWLFIPPLVFPSGSARAQQTASPMVAPRIDRFDLDPPKRLAPGEALIFRISGSPRGDASVTIDGVRGKVTLREVMTGIYEGVYTVANDDQIAVNSIVIGTLRLGNQERSTLLDQPLVENPRVAAGASLAQLLDRDALAPAAQRRDQRRDE
jgi:hypothetical protein